MNASSSMPCLDVRVPELVRPLLLRYLSEIESRLPGLVTGCYLHGSIAYGAFNPGVSDIDCLALVVRKATAGELSVLRAIHADIRNQWPHLRLEVGYVNWADCGRLAPAAPPHPFHRAGVFHDSGIFDFNSPFWSAIVWWQVKTVGINLLGPPPAALNITLTEEVLLAACRKMIMEDWRQWSCSPRSLIRLTRDNEVDWAVFGLLRTYFTLRERTITSKTAAAEYGLPHLPERWHELIRQTVAQRATPRRVGLYRRLTRAVETFLFLRYMVAECQKMADSTEEATNKSVTA